MSLNSILFITLGFCAGIGVALGTVAFFLVMKVIPRLIQKAQLEHKVIFIENMVIQGVILGTIVSLFSWKKKLMFRILGRSMLTIYGLSAGIFAGCVAIALAEILDTFPIFSRRLKLQEDKLEIFILVMAIGKTVGSLFYFLAGYGMIGE